MASSFGMNDSVISLICVAAWKMPTMQADDERGEQQRRREHAASSRARGWPMVMTVSGVIGWVT